MYIKKDSRNKFQYFTDTMHKLEIRDADELSYLLTLLMHEYLNSKPESTNMYSEAIGALEITKLELFRRHAALLGNEKLKENGDV
jgi:hypothetical protein